MILPKNIASWIESGNSGIIFTDENSATEQLDKLLTNLGA